MSSSRGGSTIHFDPKFVQLKYKSSKSSEHFGPLVNIKPVSYKIETVFEKWRKTGSLFAYVSKRGDAHYLRYNWEDVVFEEEQNCIRFDADFLGEAYEVTISAPNVESVFRCMTNPVA